MDTVMLFLLSTLFLVLAPSLILDPVGVFSAFYYMFSGTVLLSDPLPWIPLVLSAALFYASFLAGYGGRVTFHSVTITPLRLVFGFTVGYLIAKVLTGNVVLSLLAGVFVAFSSPLFRHLPHVTHGDREYPLEELFFVLLFLLFLLPGAPWAALFAIVASAVAHLVAPRAEKHPFAYTAVFSLATAFAASLLGVSVLSAAVPAGYLFGRASRMKSTALLHSLSRVTLFILLFFTAGQFSLEYVPLALAVVLARAAVLVFTHVFMGTVFVYPPERFSKEFLYSLPPSELLFALPVLAGAPSTPFLLAYVLSAGLSYIVLEHYGGVTHVHTVPHFLRRRVLSLFHYAHSRSGKYFGLVGAGLFASIFFPALYVWYGMPFYPASLLAGYALLAFVLYASLSGLLSIFREFYEGAAHILGDPRVHSSTSLAFLGYVLLLSGAMMLFSVIELKSLLLLLFSAALVVTGTYLLLHTYLVLLSVASKKTYVR